MKLPQWLFAFKSETCSNALLTFFRKNEDSKLVNAAVPASVFRLGKDADCV